MHRQRFNTSENSLEPNEKITKQLQNYKTIYYKSTEEMYLLQMITSTRIKVA
jgi:hypothetical protein